MHSHGSRVRYQGPEISIYNTHEAHFECLNAVNLIYYETCSNEPPRSITEGAMDSKT